MLNLKGIRGLVGFSSRFRPLVHPVPYLLKAYMRLYLNTFRGEPAITRFDWPFTPTHSSSELFATNTGSGLRVDFSTFHPDHG